MAGQSLSTNQLPKIRKLEGKNDDYEIEEFMDGHPTAKQTNLTVPSRAEYAKQLDFREKPVAPMRRGARGLETVDSLTELTIDTRERIRNNSTRQQSQVQSQSHSHLQLKSQESSSGIFGSILQSGKNLVNNFGRAYSGRMLANKLSSSITSTDTGYKPVITHADYEATPYRRQTRSSSSAKKPKEPAIIDLADDDDDDDNNKKCSSHGNYFDLDALEAEMTDPSYDPADPHSRLMHKNLDKFVPYPEEDVKISDPFTILYLYCGKYEACRAFSSPEDERYFSSKDSVDHRAAVSVVHNLLFEGIVHRALVLTINDAKNDVETSQRIEYIPFSAIKSFQ